MAVKPFPSQESRSDVREIVQQICAGFSDEYWNEHEQNEEFPEEFTQAINEAGLKGVLIPEEYGGGGGTIHDLLAMMEEIAAGGGGINASSSIHIPLLCVPVLLKHGSEEQKCTLLPQIASGELFITFGVTEPDAGTETTKIRTAARKVEDGWVLNGSKVWNSGALRGDKILVLARTSEGKPDKRGHGLTLFLADFDGPTIDVKSIPKIGRNAVPSCEVFFEDHPVREADVIGEIDQGFYHLLSSLNGERLILAAVAIGLGRWATEAATKYANERVIFGRPIGKNQAVQHPIAKNYLHLLAASEVLARAADMYEERGARAIGGLANAAKYLATEAGFQACDSAMQTFGGYAFAKEYNIGRHWIESRLQRNTPVTNEMVLNFVAENELGLPRSY